MTPRLRRALRLLRSERGMTVVELLTVCLILATVLGALTAAFVSASTAELQQNRRFQAQQSARLALDKIRREVHCASAVTSASADVVSETMPTQCTSNGGHTVNWCAVSVATNRYALYRTVDTTCNSSGAQQVDYLMSNSVFTATPATTTKLANLAVDFKVDLKSPSTCAPSNDCYELADNIYLRNSVRG